MQLLVVVLVVVDVVVADVVHVTVDAIVLALSIILTRWSLV
jgi:hypothetical protein